MIDDQASELESTQKTEVISIEHWQLEPVSTRIAERESRSSKCRIDAQTDEAAIGRYLAMKKNSSSLNTFIAYEKELRRWFVFIRVASKSLGSAGTEDVEAFFQLLKAPPKEWIRKRSQATQTWTALLYGPLSPQSISYTKGVLSNFYAWLLGVGYLDFNPFQVVELPRKARRETDRGFGVREWSYIVQVLDQLNPRERWQLMLAYHSGLRLSELRSSKMKDFIPGFSPQVGEYWELQVFGKGRKTRRVICNQDLMSELFRWRTAVGLPQNPTPDENIPLIPKAGARGSMKELSSRGLQYTFEQLFTKLSGLVSDGITQARLLEMSTHALRHTFASHRLASGADMFNTMQEMGHANVDSFRVYAHAEKSGRIADSRRTERKNLIDGVSRSDS